MKRIIILNLLFDRLENIDSAELFGIKSSDSAIISSLKKSEGLEKIGIFQSKMNQNKINTELILSKEGDLLLCYKNNLKIPVVVFNYKTGFNKRNEGIIDSSLLQDKTVFIVGLGSGGSVIALDLARAGVTNFIIVEPDIVSISNICRSSYDLFDVGEKKTQALFNKLLRINPCINVQLYSEDLLKMKMSKLKEVIHCSDLIIDATDSPKTNILINGLAYHHKPVLHPSAYDHGRGGEVFFTLPGGITPCFECVYKSILPQMTEVKRGEFDYSTDKSKPFPALGVDVKVIACRTTKLALTILMANQDNSIFEKIINPENNMLFIGNEKFWIFDESFQEVWAKTEINPECSCQTLL